MFTRRILGSIHNGWAHRDTLPRAWATINGGDGTLVNSFNVSALTDNAAADFTLTWQLAFNGTEYVVAGMGKPQVVNSMGVMGVSNLSPPTSTSIRVFYRNPDTAASDPPVGHVIAFGRI